MRIQSPQPIRAALLRTVAMSLALSASCLAYSQGQPPGGPGGEPPRMEFAKSLGLDAKTAKAVEQIMREDREKHMAVRRETDQKLTKVLSREQLDKLHQMMPHPPRGDAPPRKD
ncbi:MAG TPA: hypothetical protein VF450_07090 [Noviherbaspirillum sp.]